MYLAYFGLNTKPFNITPDPAFLFITEQHREALTGLTYSILDRKGFVALSGTAGAGKTTLLAWVLAKLSASQVQSSVILNPTLTRDEFLEMVMLDFGILDIPASKAQRLCILQRFLVRGQEEGKVNVLIIDEAHKLTAELLEEIRLLGNFECAQEKLIQVVLIGQSELDDLLNMPDLWQFKQRLSVRLSLQPLGVNEVGHYVAHRWSVAGGANPPPFSDDAVASLAKWSKGIPRVINSICDNALLDAFADEASCVTVDHIHCAVRDLRLADEKSITNLPAPVIPAAAPTPPPQVRPIEFRTPGRYRARPASTSIVARWAGKLGLL
jgi:general secretion pathway protein A